MKDTGAADKVLGRCHLPFRLVGVGVVLAGLASLALGPIETVCFTWFGGGGRARSGRLAYEGFGLGSFLFASVAMQFLGHYLIAGLLIPLGRGHLAPRTCTGEAVVALAQCWVILGVPLLGVVLAILASTELFSQTAAAVVLGAAVLSCLLLPWVVIRVYQGNAAREVFRILALHVLFFLNGLFPRPGGWLTGLAGHISVDAAILVLPPTVRAASQRRRWAWSAALACFAGTLLLWVASLLGTSWLTLLGTVGFPPYEVDLLDGIPAEGWHLGVLIGLPLLGSLRARTRVTILRARDGWLIHARPSQLAVRPRTLKRAAATKRRPQQGAGA